METTATTINQEETNAAVKYPSNWNVIFWNDEVTPMGFVTYILKEVFHQEEADAFDLMLKVHNEGSAIVGCYIKSIAEAKMQVAVAAANKAGYPLKITIEKAN